VLSKRPQRRIAGVPVVNYDLTQSRPSGNGATVVWSKWLVFLKPGVTDEELVDVFTQGPCKSSLRGHPSKGGVPFVRALCDEKDLEVTLLGHTQRFAFIEPDAEVSLVPATPAPPPDWGTKQSASWGLDRIGVPDTRRTGKGVHIYILDTGIYTKHTDFEDRAIPTLDLTGGSVVECNGDPACALDGNGHGTHCAGTAGGRSYGVAKEATLHAVKVLTNEGSGQFSWTVAALDWIAVSGARPAVASLSLGGRGRLESMMTAVDVAVAAGVVVVVAAGNENRNACYYTPAFVPSAITVGATEDSDARAYYSNTGWCVDLYAPGSSITSAWIGSDVDSARLSGTSMACPHVSGGAALLLHSNPAMRPAEVASALTSLAERNVVQGLSWWDWNLLLSVNNVVSRAVSQNASAILAPSTESGRRSALGVERPLLTSE